MDKGESKICNRRIVVRGHVQGIGFRPYTARMAKKHGVCGYIRNSWGNVEIFAQGTEEQVTAFLNDIKEPKLAFAFVEEIEELALGDLEGRIFDGFRIEESNSGEVDGPVYIPVDLPICESCAAELENTEDRRFSYPLNSCVACGPRFSIIRRLPYDRENTSMDVFEMCPECKKEYTTMGSRRHHAQTIGCKECGPFLIFYGRDGEVKGETALNRAIEELQAGKIVAIKGIGGYHLACLPDRDDAVRELRMIKGRDEKPFAVMFPDISEIEEVCIVSDAEKRLLLSAARPIVVLPKKRDVFSFGVTGENNSCGCFLPYTAIQLMILKKTGPLIMTSANKSTSPIIFRDEGIKNFFVDCATPLFAGVLYHEREILRRVDDSVAMVSAGHVQLIRRSRGYVPKPVRIPTRGIATAQSRSGCDCFSVNNTFGSLNKTSREVAVLGLGGDLKNAFCLAKGGYAYMSQHIGDLEDESVMRHLEEAIEDLKRLTGIRPEIVAYDSHPLYHSTAYAEQTGLKPVKVQHHHAHIASVIAENCLTEPVIGVSFDGTGYGDDGTIWGGEFLVCRGASCKRAGHLKAFRQLGGDSSAKDARKTATCMLLSEGLDEFIEERQDGKILGIEAKELQDKTKPDNTLPGKVLKDKTMACKTIPTREMTIKDMPDEEIIKAALAHNINTVESSSMGRLFDAASSILNICHYNTYEGKCAILLEQAATRGKLAGKRPAKMSFDYKWENGKIVFSARNILLSLLSSEDIEASALGFHNAVAEMIVKGCKEISGREEFSRGESIRNVALSGGVFQNRLLFEEAVRGLEEAGFKVYTNRLVPPNDAGIALGQAYIALMKEGE